MPPAHSRLPRALLTVAVALAFASAGSASALFLRKSLERVKSVTDKVVDKTQDVVKTVSKAVTDGAKSLFSAATHFGKDVIDKLKKAARAAWADTLSEAKALAAKAKAFATEAATYFTEAAQKALLAKWADDIKSVKSFIKTHYQKFETLMTDPAMKARVKNVLTAISKRKLNDEAVKDAIAIGQFFGVVNTKGASLGRRGEVAPCGGCGLKGITIGLDLGAEAVVSGSAFGGLAVIKNDHGDVQVALYGGYSFGAGVQGGAGVDLMIGFPTSSMNKLPGYGFGLQAAFEFKGGLGFGLDKNLKESKPWDSSAKNFFAAGSHTVGCATFSVGPGIGASAGIGFTWSRTWTTERYKKDDDDGGTN